MPVVYWWTLPFDPPVAYWYIRTRTNTRLASYSSIKYQYLQQQYSVWSIIGGLRLWATTAVQVVLQHHQVLVRHT